MNHSINAVINAGINYGIIKMGRRILEERNVRKLTKMSGGKSYGITLPISVIRKFGWRERQKLQLRVNNRTKSITIKDWKK